MAPSFGDFFKGLFSGGGGGDSEPVAGTPVPYEGYIITPIPRPQGGQWLTAGTITKEIGGETREYSFIRAETHTSTDAAETFAIMKGQQIVREFGDRMFDKG